MMAPTFRDNESAAGRAERLGYDLRPLAPISEARRRRRMERKRRTPDERRAETRAEILNNNALMRDPENAWRLGQLAQNDRHLKTSLRLFLLDMMLSAKPELPREEPMAAARCFRCGSILDAGYWCSRCGAPEVTDQDPRRPACSGAI